MITNSETVIDGYVSISNINLAALDNWYSAVLLILSNLFAIPAIVTGYALGFYIWGSAVLVAMIISMFYHTCQTNVYCFFAMDIDSWQRTDHITAGSLLAYSIVLFYFYRPLPPKRQYDYYNPRTFGAPQGIEYDDVLSNNDKNKVCFRCRGTNPHMVYDWQSVVISYIYIFVIIISTTALPLTTQSFVIIIIFGVIIGFIKIVYIEEGNPEYIKHRFYLPALVFGLILIIISLAFYFIDSYFYYEYFHSLWHLFSNIGLLFVLIGTTNDVVGWFTIRDLLAYSWTKTKELCCCCYSKKEKKRKKGYIEI